MEKRVGGAWSAVRKFSDEFELTGVVVVFSCSRTELGGSIGDIIVMLVVAGSIIVGEGSSAVSVVTTFGIAAEIESSSGTTRGSDGGEGSSVGSGVWGGETGNPVCVRSEQRMGILHRPEFTRSGSLLLTFAVMPYLPSFLPS